MQLPLSINYVSPLVRQAGKLVAEGRTGDTLALIQQSLNEKPGSGLVWSDAGILLFMLNRFAEALTHFERAIQCPDCPKEVWSNLARTYLALDWPESAMQLIEPLAAEGLLDESLIEAITSQWNLRKDWASAMETVCRGEKYLPESERLVRLQEQIRGRRAKIAFFCGGDGATFLNDILDFARRRYQVRVFDGSDTRQMAELMQWSDISWFEWCTNLAQLGSRLPKVCRNIIRLHRYEAYTPFVSQIQWDHIDLLITVGNSFVLDALEKQVPGIRQKVSIATIPNGVDCGRIRYTPRTSGKNIAWVASLRMVKNPMLLLQCMARLHSYDPEYRLFIAGDRNDLLLDQYMTYQIDQLGLRDVVIFDGWQKDIPNWLSDKHYLLVTSVIESQGMGCLEAMAAGIRPVIHNFPGSRETFGDNFLFNTPEEFCDHILDGEYQSEQYRDFVERRYAMTNQLRKINEIFASMESVLEQKAQCCA
jgi:glycosyltransferase involved in cell wall biosynthesis